MSLLIMISEWGPPEQNDEGKEIEDEFSQDPLVVGYFRRFLRNCLAFNQSIRDPINDKLLPDPVEPPYYQPPYTLILEMNGVLVHPEWTFATGWRYKRRTALEVFLQQVVPYYEVVVFTGENAMTAGPVLQQIDDKFQYISSRLFRDATRYENGVHIKDLSCLNRSLRKVIMVDWNKSTGKLQPRNQLCVKKWAGDDSDHELIDLAAFLRMIAQKHPDDVRPVLDYYNEFEDPMAAFREKHAQLMEEHQRRQEDASQKNKGQKSLLSGLRLR